MLLFAGCQNSTALNSLHYSIRSARVEVNFVMCAVTILVGRGSPELQQVRLLVRFSLKRLRFSLCTHTYVLLYSDTVRCPGDNSIKLGRTSGERMHRDRIPSQRTHAACRIVTRGSCCTKRFAEFNGNCESFCSLEQLVASLCAADEGKSASGTYNPKTEGGYIMYRPSGWTHGHNPSQTSCACAP